MMPPRRVAPDAVGGREGAAPALGRGRRGLPAALVVRADPLRAGAAAPGDRARTRTRSTRSSRAGSPPQGLRPRRRGVARDAVIRRAALNLTGLPPTRPRSTRSSPTRSPKRLRAGRRSAISPRRRTASAWRWTGSTSRATPTRTATRPTSTATCRRIATGSSARSTSNLPYDQFLTWQLAGDLLPNADARAAHRHRLQPAAPADQRRRQHRGGVPHRVRRRPRQHVRHGDARPDARVRALPRSQVRSDHAARLLLAVRVLQQHRRVRPVFALHERDAVAVAAALAGRDRAAARATRSQRASPRRKRQPDGAGRGGRGRVSTPGSPTRRSCDRPAPIAHLAFDTVDRRHDAGQRGSQRTAHAAGRPAARARSPASVERRAAVQRRQRRRPSRRCGTFVRTDPFSLDLRLKPTETQDRARSSCTSRARGPMPAAAASS